MLEMKKSRGFCQSNVRKEHVNSLSEKEVHSVIMNTRPAVPTDFVTHTTY